ncbi:ankyrin repeat-containing domain protein [Biscogniauxia mediterranea]|nr:ankyrin repeat-containing domain protein [Biscogniauxia mediterranea]
MEMDKPKEVTLTSNDSDPNPYERLKVKDTESPSDGVQNNDVPLIDVVHVAALCSVDDMHKLSELLALADNTERRELVFQSDLSSFLTGDLVQEFVQQEAMCLLRDLLAAGQLATLDIRRAIVFVAYDLGALVVKQALSIAAGFQNKYSSIFWNTSRVIFSGCPHRSMDTRSMISKLWTFLSGKSDNKLQRHLVPNVMENLAHITMQTSEAFTNSKIALRAHTIHLYAGDNEAGMIHPSMDAFTATMGLSSEVAIQEQSDTDLIHRFPGLMNIVTYNLNNLASHSDWVPIEQTLLALAAPPRTSQLDPREVTSFQPALDAQNYGDWDNVYRPQILYIQGHSYHLTHSVADQVMLKGMAELRGRNDYNFTKYLSFSFESRDLQRCSIPSMITSIILQAISGNITGTINQEFYILRDLFFMRGGWSDKSCLSMFEVLWTSLFFSGVTIILHDFDECDRDSRRSFLNYYSALADKTECRLKLVITSRRPNALTAELEQWPKLDVDTYLSEIVPETRNFVADTIQFCPSDPRRREVQKHLNRLSTMEQTNLHKILGLLFDHTSWPDHPSIHSLSEFTRLLFLISPCDTPERVLDKIIRSDRMADRLRWGLCWIICSYRPLTLKELVIVMEYYDKSNTTGHELSVQPVLTQPSMEAQQRLKSWLRMLTDFRDDQATIRLDLMSLIVGNTDISSYIWNEIADEAHQRLAEFCLAYLKSEKAIASLQDIVLQYETALQEQQQQFKAPMLVLPRDQGPGLLLYAVQALPYHLSKCPTSHYTNALSFFFDKSTAVVSTLWAKVYWAMSNPLSRTSAPPESALPVCASLGFLSYEKLNTETENLRVQCMSSAVIGGKGREVLSFFPPRLLSVSTCMELLLSALQANDQTTALELAQGVLSYPEQHGNTQNWPSFAIWAAVWLNMVDLTKMLLDNGVGVNIEPSVEPSIGYYPSVLHMSSMLNHPAIVETLLARGAFSKTPVLGRYASFQVAACRGHIDVVQKYLDHDASYVKNKQSFTALWAASEWGCWNSVSTLIHAGADVNEPQGQPPDDDCMWTPLATACKRGYPKTVEALLAGGADANATGPYGMATALWFSVCDNPNVDCVRVMLRYNADPNHYRLDPPLLIEMTKSIHDTVGMIPIFDALLDGIRPVSLNATDDNGETALMMASQSGKLDLVERLLASGADPDILDRWNNSALYYAIHNESVDVVAALLNKGARIDVPRASDQKPLLFYAMSTPEIARLLLEYGADVNLADSTGNMAINIALASGKVEVAKMIIEKGTDIDHMNADGWAPIFDAVYSNNVTLTRLLAENGAKMDGMASDQTLLHLSVGQDLEILKTLLEFRKSININTPNKDRFTALHFAVLESDTKYLQTLIRAGADLNAQYLGGGTPLHVAALEAKTLDALKLLLAQPDIDLDSIWPEFGTPLCVASQELNVEGTRALLDRGADVNLTRPNIPLPTPLISVLGTGGKTTRSEDVLTKDIITRMLVFNPLAQANVKQLIPGSTFYTALAAACFSAGPATLKFLVEEGAEVHLADMSGRLPHHFAAANGLDNFQAIVISYRGDLMASDKEKKNCLHWAAQFGNLRAVEFIISRLSDEGRLENYINRPDTDGWTPLCWAARPCQDGWWYIIRSEQPDFVGVVKTLLLNGAQPDVKCTLGNGTDTEKLTPLDLARRCDASEDIITMLRHGIEDRVDFEARNEVIVEGPLIFGLVFKCNTCPNFYICTKCLPHRDTSHSKETHGDEKEHNFELLTEYDEYRNKSKGEAENEDGPAEPDEQGVDEEAGSGSPEREKILDLDDIEV